MRETDRNRGSGARDPAALYEALIGAVGRVVVANERVVEALTIAALTRGHVLLEGVPGIAKTTLATLFARASGLSHARIQMTPDVLPADVTGTHVYREREGTFELRRGPIFANLVVVDELNRATPKTQSALLEAMAERQVTVDGETLDLPSPFLVVATQNPIEMQGVFDLPEAQRDRFRLKLSMDLPERDVERAILDRFDADPTLGPGAVEPVIAADDLLAARSAVEAVHVAPAVKEYTLDLVRASRDHPDVAHGASPRASLSFLDAGKARAAIRGRSYVVPDDVKTLADAVLCHRLVLSTEADLDGVVADDVVADLVASVAPPESDATVVETDVDEPA